VVASDCETVTYADDDHDGFTADVDCNDHNGSIHPGAIDTPGDGIDEDCAGGDAPLPVVDADHDGSVPPADCNDHNAAIRPGATDVPENGVDENCDGHDAAFPVLDAPITNRWQYGSRTRVLQLEVSRLTAGTRVKVTCRTKAKGCPFASKTVAVRRGKAKLTSLFKHRRLKPGARIDVSITAPAAIGKLVRFTIRRNRIPKAQTLCIRPGARPAAHC
jgi:Putative metal-binding motif